MLRIFALVQAPGKHALAVYAPSKQQAAWARPTVLYPGEYVHLFYRNDKLPATPLSLLLPCTPNRWPSIEICAVSPSFGASSNQDSVAVVYFVLDNLRCPAHIRFAPLLKILGFILHFDFLIAQGFARAPQKGQTAFLRLIGL